MISTDGLLDTRDNYWYTISTDGPNAENTARETCTSDTQTLTTSLQIIYKHTSVT